MNTIKIPTKLTLKMIRKGAADIVEIVHPNLKTITETQFKQIQNDTFKANGNKVISYSISYENRKVMMTKAEMMYAGNDHTVENMSRMGE